ncbi:MAG: class I SAM-dependent methyltransferase [Labilithrix sp.]|nr:class I SAM-dependent methyltransferase [Labilithrix sp.]
MGTRTAQETFDAGYYGRFYGSARTRVHGPKEIARLCAAVTSLLDWWQVPIDTVLDVGAGVGLWRDWFGKHRPATRYRSTEVSRYACAQYGHEQRDISRWRAKETFDLVVCQGVLPYLDDAACARALENIAAMTGGFLYLEAITKKDIREVCDDVKTDVKVHERTGAWYRARLRPHYVEVGAGLWAKKDAPVLFYELERR